MTRGPLLLGLLPGCLMVGHPCPHCVDVADDCDGGTIVAGPSAAVARVTVG